VNYIEFKLFCPELDNTRSDHNVSLFSADVHSSMLKS